VRRPHLNRPCRFSVLAWVRGADWKRARELADQVLRVYQDARLSDSLSKAGMKLVENEFSTATNRRRIVEYLAHVGLGASSRIDSTAA
jgi:hypothetical protein